MHPKEFMQHWQLTAGEMSTLLNVHPNSIYNWTAPNATKAPSDEILERLDMIHLRWLEWELQDDHLPDYVRSLYEVARDRKELRLRTETPTDADT